MIVFVSNIRSVSKQRSFRLDVKYREFKDLRGSKTIGQNNQCRLGDILKRKNIIKLPKGELEKEVKLLDLSNVVDCYQPMEDIVDVVDEIKSDKNLLDGAEMIISKIVMSKGYFFLNENQLSGYVGSTELIPYMFRREFDKEFLRSLLVQPEFLDTYVHLETGKTPSQKRVNPEELLNILIPCVDLDKQRDAGKKISVLLNENYNLEKKLEHRRDIINKHILKELNINISDLKRDQVYKKNNHQLDYDIRLGVRFNSRFYEELESKFSSFLRVSDIISEPMRMGQSITPSDYGDGEAKYLSMASIREWEINWENSERVEDEYYENNKSVASVELNDILMARSGEGTVGKIAIVEDRISAVLCDFLIRIRVKKEYDAKYVYYYMCSDLFQWFIEKEKKGLGNNMNVFPRQISRMPIILTDIARQQDIVRLINKEIKEHDKIKQLVKDNKQKIRQIIFDAIGEA